jgi:hypothetical protein
MIAFAILRTSQELQTLGFQKWSHIFFERLSILDNSVLMEGVNPKKDETFLPSSPFVCKSFIARVTVITKCEYCHLLLGHSEDN